MMEAMRRYTVPLTLALAVTALAACQPPAEEAAPGPSATELDAALDAMRTQFETLANADDAAGVGQLYTDDAVFVDVEGGVHQGRAAIQAYFAANFANASDLSIQESGRVVQGDMVVARGTYSQTVQGPDGPMTMSGMWMAASLYQPDGSMRIRMHQSMVPMPPSM